MMSIWYCDSCDITYGPEHMCTACGVSGIRQELVESKTTKTFVFWVNCYDSGRYQTFNTKERADDYASHRLGPAERIEIVRELPVEGILDKKKTKTFTFWVNFYNKNDAEIYESKVRADACSSARAEFQYKRLGPAEKITIEREI